MPKGDREILKADPEDGTTPIANLLLEAIAIAKLTGKEKGAILFLCRRTYGWGCGLNRLKEAEIPLGAWANILHADTSKASTIISGLVKKQIFKREFAGPGMGYTYSINTRVAEWGNGCLNRQLLSDLARQPLPKKAREQLSKTTTPLATSLATPKSILKQYKSSNTDNKDIKDNKDNKEVLISGQTIESARAIAKGEVVGISKKRQLYFQQELKKSGNDIPLVQG